MHIEWSEEQFLKGIVGDKTRLRFWNNFLKQTPKAIRDDLEPTPPPARKLRPTLLPIVDLALFPRPLFVWTMFNSISVYLCPFCLHSHLYDLAIKMPVRHVPLGSASVAAKDGRPYTIIQTTHFTTSTTPPPTPWQDFKNGLGCTLLQHPTSHALLTSPIPCQRVLVCGACIGTAQIDASLVAPHGFIFKRSSLRSFRDMIIISWIYTLLFTTSRWKV